MFRIKIPATSANLGPAFDCMGLALKLYNYITVEKSNYLKISLKGSYTSDIPTDENNLIWQTILFLWEKIDFTPQPLSLILESHVPPARGLGSSSTAVVGGLLIANEIAGSPLSRYELLKLATEIEGHPDNVTPALYGGITLTVMSEQGLIPRVLSQNPSFKAVTVIPDMLVKTEEARKILPTTLSRQDTIFNISRVGLLVDAFVNQEYELLAVATEDRIHQNQRASLIPGMPEALKTALESGAYGSALSGSGPTLIAFSPAGVEQKISQQMLAVFSKHNISSTSLVLEVDSNGAVVVNG